ncbi:MAG TPA: FtsX-like permease family protein [Jiangellaceae bacterium]|nr:FtsX-like permease family protein [Jiangellaceae bacterium]
MVRITLAGLRHHPLRFVLTGIVVVLSVGFTAGSLVLTDSLNQAAATEGAPKADFLRFLLLMLGAVSLIVAAFVIANTFRITVAQRTRELALARTIGATRRQVATGVLIEAGAVGLAGGITGVALGVAAGAALGRLIADGTYELPIVVSAPMIVWSLAIGLAVTVGSAVHPAIAATKVAPLAAVRAVPDGADSPGASRVRVRTGLILSAAGVLLLGAGAALPLAGYGLVLVVPGAAVCFLGILVLGPRIVPPLLQALGGAAAALSPRSRPTTRLATANAVRNPKRAATTAAALLIGVTVVTGFVTVAESTRSSIGVIIDQQVPADFVVTTHSGGGVPTTAIAAIEALPAMGASVSLYRTTATALGGGQVDVAGLDLRRYDQIAQVSGDGSLSDVAAGGAAIDEATAQRHGLSLGDRLTVAGRTFRVAFVADLRNVPFANVIVPPEDFLALFPDVDGPEQFAVDAAEGVPVADARAAIEAVAEELPDVSVYSAVESRQELNRQLDRAVSVVVAILGLAVVIAAIGIANTLSLAVHERTREIGLLRALGVTARQTRVMLGVEAMLASVSAAIVGVAVGVVFAWAAVATIPNLVFTVPWGGLVLCSVAAGMLGLLASIVPARRAARLSPVAALATE